jgi:pimeloyl-ACP methyl ester carboxylesterase
MIKFTKSKIKKIILAKEVQLASSDDLFKFSKIETWSAEPSLKKLQAWSKDRTKKSNLFFKAPKIKVHLEKDLLKFDSPVNSAYPQNNKVHAQYFKSKRPTKAAVIILGHWNSDKKTYNKLARFYRLAGFSAVRLSLPYHDERRSSDMPIAKPMLSADLNQTIESMQQATIETKIIIDWLEKKGYTNIGIVGASLGSSVALLAAAHDKRIKAAVLYLSAAATAELVWQSTATAHLRESFNSGLTLEDLGKAWSCISPSNYLHKLARKDFAVHVAWGRYDSVCPVELTQRMLDDFRKLNVKTNDVSYPCGHNTLGIAPFIHVAGFRGLTFMKSRLKP